MLTLGFPFLGLNNSEITVRQSELFFLSCFITLVRLHIMFNSHGHSINFSDLGKLSFIIKYGWL